MIKQNIFIPLTTKEYQPSLTGKATWLVILHAQRIPPHAGLLFNGNYNSLTIKEAELNINSALLLKTLSQKKIKSVFIKILPHPVFSIDHQRDMFQEELKKAGSVEQYKSTCLSPVKTFFKEFYGIQSPENELLFDFIRQLTENGYIEYAMPVNMKLNEGLELPFYSVEELNDKIRSERQIYFNT
ncbi:MAG: hypothetical protein ACXVNM_08465 [Bacteroidia bacterium]